MGVPKRRIEKTLTATSHPLMGLRNRNRTVCFITALVRCTAARNGSALPCVVAFECLCRL
jgi:hypothetical protein